MTDTEKLRIEHSEAAQNMEVLKAQLKFATERYGELTNKLVQATNKNGKQIKEEVTDGKS